MARIERQILSVRELTLYIKGLLEQDPFLASVWVKGEISNFKHYPSGHMYFTIKDADSAMPCVFFRGDNATLRFRPTDGMQVLVWGNVGVYERDGRYQFYVRSMEAAGLGGLYMAFEQLKAKLGAEGLFEAARKRPLPLLPHKVGVVTSAAGAALRDIITVARRRHPGIDIVLAPALVQGADAPASIVRALQLVARVPGVDVIICGRGGGSLEDLWAFNDEAVARAIAACPVPVIAAVGHETDVSIADFVADRRAATPSNAAELAVPVRAEWLGALDAYRYRLAQALRTRIQRQRTRLEGLQRRAALERPRQRLAQNRQHIDQLVHRLGLAARRRVAEKRSVLQDSVSRLNALSPLAVLGRGYAIARHQGAVLRDAGAVAPGAEIEVLLQRGSLHAVVGRVDLPDPGEG